MQNLSALLKKYDVQGPRYTSYPTVPYWDSTPSQAEWIEYLRTEIDQSKQKGRGAALYLHIPFCEQLCTFCACNRIITKKHERSAQYIETVLKEWRLYQDTVGFKTLDVSEIHLGGGTPTFLSADELRALLKPILADCILLPDTELSFETDPRVTTTDHLQAMAELGFRRISLGVQDYDPIVQKAIHREQSVEMVSKLCAESRALGFTGINFDLVYGLPHQTLQTIDQTIDHVIAQKPDRIAFYAYAHVPWVGKTGQRGFEDSDLPQAEMKRNLYEHGRQKLEAAGYVEVGMDHFALPHDKLFKAARENTLFRNFMGYVPYHVSPMISLGVSAISDSWTCFVQNEKALPVYEERIARGELPIFRGHKLTEEDLRLRRIILDLMTRFETNWPVEDASFGALLAEAQKDGLVAISGQTIKVTDLGRPFIRNICMAFDARLQRKQPETQIFSRTI